MVGVEAGRWYCCTSFCFLFAPKKNRVKGTSTDKNCHVDHANVIKTKKRYSAIIILLSSNSTTKLKGLTTHRFVLIGDQHVLDIVVQVQVVQVLLSNQSVGRRTLV